MPAKSSAAKLRRASPESRPDGEAPLYAVLAKTLEDAIRSGHYAEGGLLPTELALSQAHGVSRQTVREALRRLEDQGLLTRRRGVGTRVSAAPGERRFVLEIGSMPDIVEYARRVRLQVDSIRAVRASARLATELECREGTRWLEVRGRRFLIDAPQSPVAVVQMHVRARYPGIEERLRAIGDTAVHALLERDYGEQIEEFVQEVTAIAMPPAAADLLGVARGSRA